MHMSIYMYIYIYVYRERDMCICMCIYIYIYVIYHAAAPPGRPRAGGPSTRPAPGGKG